MAVLRGSIFAVACVMLFTIGGGLMAAGLNWLAPGYYPGVFPNTHRPGFAVNVGIVTGTMQGLMLGMLVGSMVTLTLGWFGKLQWSSCAWGIAILAGCAVGFTLIGGLIGVSVGAYVPEYYRSVIRGGQAPDFSPTDVGIGLGASQGAIVGVLIGGLAVVVLTVLTRRRATPWEEVEA